MEKKSQNNNYNKYLTLTIVLILLSAVIIFMLSVILPINYQENWRFFAELWRGGWEGFIFLLLALVFSFKKDFSKTMIMCIIFIIGVGINILITFISISAYDDFVNSINLILITVDLVFVSLPLMVLNIYISKKVETL